MEISEDKKLILGMSDRKMVVTAGPGSGKTHLLVELIKQELSKEKTLEQGVIACSFTKNASNEIKGRLSSNIKGMNISFIDTLDSFVYREIIYPFLNRYYDLKGLSVINKFMIQTLIIKKDNRFIKITDNNILENMYAGWKNDLHSGKYCLNIFSYKFAIDLILSLDLVSSYLDSRYSRLFIDEAQDLNRYQFELVRVLLDKCPNMSCVLLGDVKQSIFQWRGAVPKEFLGVVDYGFVSYSLTETFRCDPKILEFANSVVLDKRDSILVNRQIISLEVQPKSLIGKTNVMVLFENNYDANKFYKGCMDIGIPFVYSRRLELSNSFYNEQYLDLIEEISSFYYNFENQEPSLVYSIDDYVNYLSNYVVFGKRISEKVLVKIDVDISEYVRLVFNELGISILDDVLKDINNKFEDSVVVNYYKGQMNVNRIMTIHSAKGLEADNVILKLAENSMYGNPADEESKQKLFVACTRAKKHLVIDMDDGYRSTDMGKYLLSKLSLLKYSLTN